MIFNLGSGLPLPIPAQDMVTGLVALEIIQQHDAGIAGLRHPELVGNYLQECVESGGHSDG